MLYYTVLNHLILYLKEAGDVSNNRTASKSSGKVAFDDFTPSSNIQMVNPLPIFCLYLCIYLCIINFYSETSFKGIAILLTFIHLTSCLEFNMG